MGSVNKQFVTIGLGLLGIGILGVTGTLQIEINTPSEAGSRLFPMLISCILIGLGALRVIMGIVNSSSVTQGNWVTLPTNFSRILWVSLLCLIYVWAMGALGYLLATAILSPLVFMLFGERRPSRLLLAAILSPAIYHLIFFEGLGGFPPQGEYFDLLNFIRGY